MSESLIHRLLDERKSFIAYFFKRKYRKIQSYFVRLKTSPNAKVAMILTWQSTLCWIVGIDFIDPKFKPWWFSYFTAAIVCDFVVISLYTVYYYLDTKNYSMAVASMCTYGATLPVNI